MVGERCEPGGGFSSRDEGGERSGDTAALGCGAAIQTRERGKGIEHAVGVLVVSYRPGGLGPHIDCPVRSRALVPLGLFNSDGLPE